MLWFLESIDPPFYFENYEARSLASEDNGVNYSVLHVDPNIYSEYKRPQLILRYLDMKAIEVL